MTEDRDILVEEVVETKKNKLNVSKKGIVIGIAATAIIGSLLVMSFKPKYKINDEESYQAEYDYTLELLEEYGIYEGYTTVSDMVLEDENSNGSYTGKKYDDLVYAKLSAVYDESVKEIKDMEDGFSKVDSYMEDLEMLVGEETAKNIEKLLYEIKDIYKELSKNTKDLRRKYTGEKMTEKDVQEMKDNLELAEQKQTTMSMLLAKGALGNLFKGNN